MVVGCLPAYSNLQPSTSVKFYSNNIFYIERSNFMNHDSSNSEVGSINCFVVSGINKNGKEYQAIQFSIITEMGEYKSPLCFPSPLEKELVLRAIGE